MANDNNDAPPSHPADLIVFYIELFAHSERHMRYRYWAPKMSKDEEHPFGFCLIETQRDEGWRPCVFHTPIEYLVSKLLWRLAIGNDLPGVQRDGDQVTIDLTHYSLEFILTI